MSSALLDIAESALRARPSRPAGPGQPDAAGIRGRLGQWLGRLAGIGAALGAGMNSLAAYRRARGLDPAPARVPRGCADLAVGWALVARAARWIRALRARLAAEAALDGFGTKRAETLLGDLDGDLYDDPNDDPYGDLYGTRRAPPAGPSLPDDCIEGLPAAEVVGQICADLDAAATILRSVSSAREIAAIAAAARALLGGPAETWTPLPLDFGQPHPASAAPPATMQAEAMQAVPSPAPVSAPLALPVLDTG